MTGWPHIPAAVRLVGGVLALWLAWLAAVQARINGQLGVRLGDGFAVAVELLVGAAIALFAPVRRTKAPRWESGDADTVASEAGAGRAGESGGLAVAPGPDRSGLAGLGTDPS